MLYLRFGQLYQAEHISIETRLFCPFLGKRMWPGAETASFNRSFDRKSAPERRRNGVLAPKKQAPKNKRTGPE